MRAGAPGGRAYGRDGQQSPQMMPPPVGQGERGHDGAQGEQHSQQGLLPCAAGGHDDEQREVRGHREVLQHQHEQHGRGLPVAHPPQVAQEPGDDAGGGDVGHPGERQDAAGVQPEQPSRHRTGGRVQQEIHPCRGQVAAQTDRELRHGEFETEHQQQQDDADARAGLHEGGGCGDRCDSSLAQRQARQEIQRDRGQRATPCQRAEQTQRDQDGAQLQQQRDRDVHPLSPGRSPRSTRRSVSVPWILPAGGRRTECRGAPRPARR